MNGGRIQGEWRKDEGREAGEGFCPDMLPRLCQGSVEEERKPERITGGASAQKENERVRENGV